MATTTAIMRRKKPMRRCPICRRNETADYIDEDAGLWRPDWRPDWRMDWRVERLVGRHAPGIRSSGIHARGWNLQKENPARPRRHRTKSSAGRRARRRGQTG